MSACERKSGRHRSVFQIAHRRPRHPRREYVNRAADFGPGAQGTRDLGDAERLRADGRGFVRFTEVGQNACHQRLEVAVVPEGELCGSQFPLEDRQGPVGLPGSNSL